MNRNKYKCGEKKVKYALRKLSQGVFSVAIGSALFYSGPIMNNVHADAISNADKVIQGLQNKDSNFAKVELIPILKSELNNNEKSKITKNLPKITVNKNQKYYLVYQKNSQNILPKTNEVKSSINYLFIGSSIVLASWILLSKKARKSKFLFSVLLLNSFSGVQVLGLTMSNDQLLNRYKQTVEVPVGSSLPNIDVNIPGYEFLGYAPVENYSGKNDILKSNIGNKKPEENIKEVKSSIATKKDETVTEVIPYTTKTIDNPELEEGITKVKTAGENGIRSIVYKVTYDATGKEINRVEVSNTVTKAPVEEVIERGTKPKVTTTEKDETVTEVIPYTTKTVDNPELEEGITKVKTAGENGIRSIVYKVTYDATGKEINRVEVSNTVTKAPVEEVIERGTKPKVTTTEKDETVTEVIPYTTKTIDNPELEEGITKVKTAGENGIRSIVYKVTYDATGKEINRVEVSNTVTKAPVEEVIERGTKPKVTTTEKDETVTEVIPYTTKTVDNPELEEGITKVKTAGENGIRSIVYKVTYDATGKEINRVEVSNTVTKAPVEEVIERGTKPKVTTTEKDETVTEVIPYTTKTIDNPELEEGITKVKTAGENGIRSIVYKVTYDATGKEINRVEVSNTVTKAPVEEVIERGTKPKVTTTEKDETVTEVIPYTTKTVDNPELEEGITKVKTAGENGIRSIVYKVTYDATGKEINRVEVSNTVTKAPVEEVIERGTKPKVTTTEKDETVTEVIPYTTKTVDNPELEEGITKVKTAGENGIRSIVYKVTYDATGKEINRVEVSNTVTKAPVEEVIERGTKKVKIDKNKLEIVIDQAKTYQENQYTTASWDVLRKALSSAEQTFNDTNSTQEQVDQAVSTLQASIKQLEKKPVNKEQLKQLIDQTKTYQENQYTTASWDVLRKALSSAEQTFNDTNSTQEQVDQAVSTLQASIKQLEKKPVNKEQLKQLIDQTKTYQENQYTTASWDVLRKALSSAEQTFNDTNSTQEQVDQAVSTLQASIKQLEKKPVNKEQLKQLIDQTKTYQENQYTTASWDVLRKALSSAEQTFNDTNSTQEQVDQAVSTLQASIKQLEKKPVNKEQLKQLIDQTKTYQENQYTTASWDVLRKALSSAEQTFNDTNSTQEQVDQVVSTLQASIKQLEKKPVNKEQLKQLIDQTKTYQENQYTTASWDVLRKALSSAEQTFNDTNSTQEQVDQAVSTLQASIKQLEKKPVNKEQLKQLIDQTKTYQENQYTTASWDVLRKALSSAEQTFNDTNSTQEQVDQAVSTLQASIKQLEKKPVNKEQLKQLIDQTKTYQENQYTTASWDVLRKALSSAEQTFNDTNSTQEQVDQVVSTLQASIKQLEKKPVNKEQLKQLIDQTKTYQENQYTTASWDVLRKALSSAEQTFNDTNSTQEQVDQAVSTLQASIKQLEKKPVNKEQLKQLIDQTKTYQENQYTTASWDVLRKALSSAEQTFNDTNSTQEQVDQAVSTLQASIKQLEKKPVNKEQLKQLIDQTKTYQENQYTTASWDVLRKALSSAEQTFNDTNSTQEQVDQAVSTLQASIKQLEKKPVNKEQLKQLIDQTKTYQENQYTTASWDVLRKALSSAEQTFNDTNSTQEQVDQVVSTLQASIKQLEKKQIEPKVILKNVIPDIVQKSASIDYKIVDPDSTIQSVQVNVYQGDKFVEQKELSLINYTVIINNLAYNTPYTLETIYRFSLNGQTISKTQNETQIIELLPKKLEINNYASTKLYKLNTNGELQNIIGLSDIPQDYSNYIVKVDTLNNKDILLPVHQIQEVTQDGIAKYKVIVHYPELVTYDPKTNDYIENYSFYINKIIKKENEYTTFNELVNAINKNPSGTFVVGSDLSASNSSVTGDSYISVDFTGTLKSEYGHTYNIYNLSKPLFNSIMNSTIKDINLLDVSISGSQSNVGALAKTAINSVIDNVHVSGKISAPTNIGGVVYSLTKNSTILNSSFTGSINLTSSQNYFVGGLVGNLSGQSIINRSYADINIVATAYRNDNKIGGLVGQSDSNTLIENSYVTGKIKNSGTGGFVGGIIGSAWWNGRLQNIITSVKVTGGNIIHGDTGYTNAPFTNIYYVEGNASGNTNHQSTGITTNKAKELINNWNIKIIPIEPNYNLINYSYLLGYEKDREVSYHNIEKLIPLYDRYTILRYGNLVNKNDKLYTTKILSVTPMQNNFIITDIFSNLNKINRLLIHYEDGTVEFMKLSNSSTFKNTNLVEFQLGDNLIYTPMQFKSDFSNVLTNVLRKFQDIEYLSPDMLNKFGFMWTQNEIQAAQNKAIQDYKNNTKNPPINPEKEQELKQKALQDLQTSKYNKLRDMYLLESFTEVKKNISKELKSILTNGSVVDLNSLGIVKYLTDKLQNQALNLLLGLSYVNRLYNINYGDINIKDLAMYRTDFYGIKSNNLDWLISFGNIGYENLRVKNNYNSFSAQFSSITGKADLIDYLDYNRNLFLPNVDENNWFKSATKAYIYEAASKEVPNADVKIYSRLKGKYRAEYKNFILPLLNLKSNDVFVVTNMSTITFGLYERYIDEALKKTPTIYAQKVKEFEKTINHYGDLWAGYYDTWYRIVDDKVKSKLYTSDIPVWDGYWIIDNTQSGYWKNRWVGPYDSSVPGMTEFFGAIGKWYNPNGTGAYANGSLVHFVVDAVVSDYGTSTLTHEMTHNFDGKIYLNGYGRRNGQYAENFAMGLLQSPYTKDSSIYGLNLVYNWPEDSLRSQNYSPSIFKSDLDLGNYMHGVFDVTYLLDYVEAEVSLAKEKNDQKLLYKKLTSSGGTDKVVDFTDEEWNRMNLRTVNDLIDYNVVSSRYYKGANVGNNSYFEVSMYAPIYAGLQSTTGVSGGLIFRKSAYELLAAKGWDNGFVSYTSNQYADDAKNEGQVFSDSYVVHKILGNEYNDYAAFKKAMFQERIAKKDKLREITINWDNSNRTIRSYEDLKSLFEDALNKDLALAKSNRNMHYIDDLKSKIMQSCHLLTNDFKSSIFK